MKFQNISDSEFAEKIMNSLPGIFYLYEKVGDQFLLKSWNTNHVKDLGYSHEKLLNMSGAAFFTEQEFKRVVKAIGQVFNKGTAQINTKIVTKSGKQIPYLLEAFSFVDNDHYYFMGVGIDITAQLKIGENFNRAIVKQERLEQDKAKAEKLLEMKNRELITSALETSKTTKVVHYTIVQLNELIEKCSDKNLSDDLNRIQKNIEIQFEKKDNWEVFKRRFTEIYEDFFDNLYKKHPGLTKNEIKFCAYLRIRLSSSQIANIQNITHESIIKTRYRIRKKMGLKTEDSLEDYIIQNGY